MAGLMWGSPVREAPRDIRHEARREDGLSKFGWHRHDLRAFGEQTVLDRGLQVDMAFVKAPGGHGAAGAGFGGSWAVRANASEAVAASLSDAKGFATLYWYLGRMPSDAALAAGVQADSWPTLNVSDATDMSVCSLAATAAVLCAPSHHRCFVKDVRDARASATR